MSTMERFCSTVYVLVELLNEHEICDMAACDCRVFDIEETTPEDGLQANSIFRRLEVDIIS